MSRRAEDARNILGSTLAVCGLEPRTGFFRDGCCNTDEHDRGSHTVCSRVTAAFLAFSKAQGNDLSTPRPEYQFPGLKPGDAWCLCASRWLEAHRAGVAPHVIAASTHERAADIVPRELLLQLALDVQ